MTNESLQPARMTMHSEISSDFQRIVNLITTTEARFKGIVASRDTEIAKVSAVNELMQGLIPNLATREGIFMIQKLSELLDRMAFFTSNQLDKMADEDEDEDER